MVKVISKRCENVRPGSFTALIFLALMMPRTLEKIKEFTGENCEFRIFDRFRSLKNMGYSIGFDGDKYELIETLQSFYPANEIGCRPNRVPNPFNLPVAQNLGLVAIAQRRFHDVGPTVLRRLKERGLIRPVMRRERGVQVPRYFVPLEVMQRLEEAA